MHGKPNPLNRSHPYLPVYKAHPGTREVCIRKDDDVGDEPHFALRVHRVDWS